MIINIRGTSGSGKSFLVRRLMAGMGHGEDVCEWGRPVGVSYPTSGWVVLGSYKEGKLTGGIDNLGGPVKLRENRWGLISRLAAEGQSIIFEGLMDGNEVRRTITLSKVVPVHVLFLDTAIGDCLAAINDRRAVRGVTAPVSEKNTREKHAELQRVARRLRAAGVTVEHLGREAAHLRCLVLMGITAAQ